MKFQVKCELIKKEKLNKNIYKFSVKSSEIAKEAKPGQFLEIKVSETEAPFLRRPISIYNICAEEETVEFVFEVKGKGTELLSKTEVGKYIDIIGPLGKGTFDIGNYKNIAILGGGIGIFPLHELAKQLKNKTKSNLNVYLGFRNKELVICEKDFELLANKLVITTDDGSYINKGFAIDYLKEDAKESKLDCIYACGPLPMLKAIQKYALENNIPCQMSLEEKMGCGVGACLGCAVRVNTEEITYRHVCKDGPVFWAQDVQI